MLPLISVLIPVFNSSRFILKTLNSIINQTYSNIEIIIVDDCSIDNTRDIIDKFIIDNPGIRIRLIVNQSNQGVSVGRNTLIDNASGDYVLFVDSDDIIDPDMVEYLYSILSANLTDVAQCLYYSEDEAGKPSGSENDFFSPTKLSGKDAVLAMLDGRVTGYLWHKLFARQLFKNVSFDRDLTVFEDFEVIISIFINGASISFGKEKKYHYIQHPSSLTKQAIKKMRQRVFYLERTEKMVLPLLKNSNEHSVLLLHKALVLLSVYINMVKNDAVVDDIMFIRSHIKKINLIKLKNGLGVQRTVYIYLAAFLPSVFERLIKIKS